MITINYGINRRFGSGIQHRNGKLRVQGTLDETGTHERIRWRIAARHPRWKLTGYTLAPAPIPTHVFMVMPRFVSLIEGGFKGTTVRSNRKRMPRAGEYIDLRCWHGKPYRSKQRRVLLCMIHSVQRFSIDAQGSFYRDGRKLDPDRRELLARVDGFPSAASMVAFFHAVHGLPFHGFITEWLT